MVVSMTGFGRSKKESSSFSVLVEIKSVNHRFCEYLLRMPRQFLKLEDKVKKRLSEHIHRGRVEVYITIEGSGIFKQKLNVDWDLLEEYFQTIQKIKQKYSLTGDISIQELLKRDDMIHIEEEESGNEEFEHLLFEAIDEAAIQLRNMRVAEGKDLYRDVDNQLQALEMVASKVRELAPKVAELYHERIQKRVQEFLEGQLEEARILTEVAIFAEKADINEELTRLLSHIKQFKETMQLNEPVGRKLDFLLQEMNREANTIGSKANHSSIAKEVVEMKSLLEKMKEQIQNIE